MRISVVAANQALAMHAPSVFALQNKYSKVDVIQTFESLSVIYICVILTSKW